MAFTRVWNLAYEATPPSSQVVKQGAQRIQEFKLDVRERLEIDHSWAGDANDGMHSKVTLRKTTLPGAVADAGVLYSDDVAGIPELRYRDEAGSITTFTSGGKHSLITTANDFEKAQTTVRVGLSDAATIALTVSNSNDFSVELGGNRTLGNPVGGKDGQVITIQVTQDGTGGRTLAFGANYKKAAGDDLTLSTGANKVDLLTIYMRTATLASVFIKKDITAAI
ncbi:MAG: hypothetical protein ACRD4B_09550 [Acidobacteriota bacterium]